MQKYETHFQLLFQGVCPLFSHKSLPQTMHYTTFWSRWINDSLNEDLTKFRHKPKSKMIFYEFNYILLASKMLWSKSSNSIFFFSKYGNFVPFLLKKTFVWLTTLFFITKWQNFQNKQIDGHCYWYFNSGINYYN